VSDNIAGAKFLGFAIRILIFMEHYSEGYASHPSIGHNKKSGIVIMNITGKHGKFIK
jgi:hypothetical protein